MHTSWNESIGNEQMHGCIRHSSRSLRSAASMPKQTPARVPRPLPYKSPGTGRAQNRHVHAQVYRPRLAQQEDFVKFHSEDYIHFLKNISPQTMVRQLNGRRAN
jgi:acetoin utilization deacetylase AcuC-like enzyme